MTVRLVIVTVVGLITSAENNSAMNHAAREHAHGPVGWDHAFRRTKCSLL